MVTVNTLRGFTLIELLITMVVLAIVASVAIPSFVTVMKNNRSVVLAEEFTGALQFARAEAVKRSRMVTVCASDDGSSCAGNWSDGFIVVVDSAASETAGAVSIANATDVLRIWDKIGEDAVITSTPADMFFLRYTSTGRLAQLGTPPFGFKTSVTDCKGGAKDLSVSLAGSISVTRSDCP